jgi:hypothetical protein
MPAMVKILYWRRELPPLSEQIEGEHEVTADSAKVHVSWADRDTLWSRGGSCAHIVDEAVTARRDEHTGESWLHGRFRFVLYVHPPDVATS